MAPVDRAARQIEAETERRQQAALPFDITRRPVRRRIERFEQQPRTPQRHRYAARARAAGPATSAAAAARPASRSGSSIKRAAWARTNSQATEPRCSERRPRQTAATRFPAATPPAISATARRAPAPDGARARGSAIRRSRALAMPAQRHDKPGISPLHQWSNMKKSRLRRPAAASFRGAGMTPRARNP